MAAGAVVALGGATLLGFGPRFQSRRPAVTPEVIGAALESQLREVGGGLHARVGTLAGLDSLRASVSTDAETARDQTARERMFRPDKGETMTIGQVTTAGTSTVLLVLPADEDPATALDRSGQRLEVRRDALFITEVMAVAPSDPERAKELRGALALCRPVELQPFVEKLDQYGAGASIDVGGKQVRVGRRIGAPDEEMATLPIGGPLGAQLKVVVAIPMLSSGPPLRPIGGGLIGVGVVLAGLGLRPRRRSASSPALDSTMPGSQLHSLSLSEGSVVDGTYEITGLLGKGGMGTVWLARHLRLPDKRVAIKLLSSEVSNPELLARFKREAEITSKLGHPNIVGVLDFNSLPSGTPYLVLEYLEGESLSSRIARGPISLDETLELTRQIGSALHAAHRAGIVHRDLKPDNIFLVPTDRGPLVKVLDFGISKMRGNVTLQTQDATMLGTPQYMSPEQANGKNSEVDARTDVWALGTIVHEMLTGQPTFAGDTMTTLLVNVLVNPAPTLKGTSGIPDRVADAIDRALAKELPVRWPDMPAFVSALTGAPLQSMPAQALPDV